jgi:Protein of unknown function (DUF3572)
MPAKIRKKRQPPYLAGWQTSRTCWRVRQAAHDPGFLAGLTDFLMSHEPDLMAFCAATGTSPETVAAAWHHFSGPGLDSGVY